MKTAAEKSTTPSRSHPHSGPFFSPTPGGKGGDFFAPTVQAKLTVGKEGDKFEQEADMMADKAVQRAAIPNLQRKCEACEEKDKLQRKPLAAGITPFIQKKEKEEEPVQRKEQEEEPVQAKHLQRKEEEEEPVQAKHLQRKEQEEEPVQAKHLQRKEEEEEPIQAKRLQRKEEEEEPIQAKRLQRKEEEEEPVQMKSATGQGQPDLGLVEWMLGDAKGLGSPLPESVLRDMEAGYGVDLGQVRIHTDQAAVDMNQMLSAQAFTNGWDVFFNQHKYNPNTTSGKLLLAHELAHTIQQAKANGEELKPAPTRMEPEIPMVPDEQQALAAAMQQAEANATGIMAEQAEVPQNLPPRKDGAAAKKPEKPAPKKPGQLPSCKPKPKGKGTAPAVGKEASLAPAAEAKPETAPAPAQAVQPPVVEQAPKCPADDPDFKKAKGKIAKDAKKQRSHEPASQKRDEAMAASAMTTAEQNLQSGQDQQAENLEVAANPPQRFDRNCFKQKLRCKIESKMPETEGEANDFADSGKLEEAKQEFQGTVGEEKSKVSGPLEQTKEQPLPEGQNLKPDNVAVPEAKPADKPTTVPSGLAAPKPKTDAEISLEHKSKGLDDQMAQEGLTEQQLAESEEPQFEKALQSKKDAQREIAAAPGHYRQVEEAQLAESKKDADKETGKELRGMAATKNQKTANVFGGQQRKETATEKRQREIKEEIDRIYNQTETDVTQMLETLTTTVEGMFSTAVEAANETFKERVRSRLDDHYGWFTFDDKLAEWAGMSDGVAHIFREEKENFLSTMDIALEEIATEVETKLNSALDRIKQGRTELDNFKKTLSDDELKFAEEMLLEAGEKFGELEATVNESQDELIESLSDLYVENVNKLQEEFDKINEELSASWIADAISFIGDVASAIKKLGQLLKSIATRIGQYISDILASPKRFFNNLVDGIKGGMDEFRDNIDTYLEKGFWMWLTGASTATKITIPDKMDVEGMFGLAAQILGITKEFILERIKAVLRIPVDKFLELYEKADSAAAKIMEPVKILFTKGIGALWVWVKDTISSKLDEIFSGLKTDIFQAIIKKFLAWVAQLFIPGLGFIKLIQAAYKALRWLVDNIDRIAEIVNSFLDAIGMAVAGNVSGIVKNVVKALTNGVVIAIDFLAKLVGLGNFSDKLQRGIQKLQKPVKGAIDFVLRKARPFVNKVMRAVMKGAKMVKKGFVKGKEKGKAVVRKIASILFPKKQFSAGGETHTISIADKGKDLKMMIASSPQDILTFVKNYEDKYELEDYQKEEIKEIKAYVKGPIEGTMEKIEAGREKGETEEKLKPLLKKLLDHEVKISEHLKKLLEGDTSFKKDKDKYLLEGLTGTYSSMPKPPSDDFTADHQPQAAVLKTAGKLTIFKGTKLKEISEQGHVKGGYAINLHKNRHHAGRTYGGKGKSTKAAFIGEINVIKRDRTKTDDEKRTLVIKQIRQELSEDVKMIKSKAVPTNKGIWADMKRIPSNERTILIKNVSERINEGENKIAAQDLNKLKEKA